MTEETKADTFAEFFAETQPRLKHALVAALGTDLGIEATQEALAWGWEHWDKVSGMENPAGYLYRVGRSRSRRFRWRPGPLPVVRIEEDSLPWVEPGLPNALGKLSERQRVAVILIHSLGWTYREAAELLGVSVGTVQTHADRGLTRLRHALGEVAHEH